MTPQGTLSDVPGGAVREAPRGALRALTPGMPSNRLLRFTLLVIALFPTLIAFSDLVRVHGRGIDLEIPLRAAQRWVDGGQPYLASSFQQGPGPDLPFLYPPFVLPFLAPLLSLPRDLVLYAWVAVCLGGSIWALRRLRVPWFVMPLILISPPFAEGIIGGNVQVLLFAAFAALFFARFSGATRGGDAAGVADLHPVHRDPTDPATPALREGLLATVIAALKVSQLHSWVYLLLKRPGAALLGVAVVGAVVAATVPLTGIEVWFDWLAQVRRAADPSWSIGGLSIAKYVAPVLAYGFLVFTVVALWFVPRATAGTWVGMLAVVGAPSLHVFGMLFMVPAWLAIRRELALIAGFFIGTFTEPGVWIAVAIVAVAWSLGATRWAWLLEPPTAVGPATVVDDASGEPAGGRGPEDRLEPEALASAR